MRLPSAALAILLILTAGCTGDDASQDATAFCELMQEFSDLAEQALAADTTEADIEELTDRLQVVITDASSEAPSSIADIFSSTDPDDQEQIIAFVRDECGVTLPGFD